MNTQSTQYFDSVLYARAYLNEVKIIQGKKGAKDYCAVNATIIAEEDGKTVYRIIDMVVRGKPAKQILWSLKDCWPADRTKREAKPWIADINVGSIRVAAYRKKDGSTGAVLKGRLLNIRNLNIGTDIVVGEMDKDNIPAPTYIASCYINQVNTDKRTMKIAALDGEVSSPESFGITVNYGQDANISEMLAMGICPQGYEQRAHNPRVFAIIVMMGLSAHVFASKDGDKPYARADLVQVRYLKADGEVIVSGRNAAA